MYKADIQLTPKNIDEILKADATGRNKDINLLLRFLSSLQTKQDGALP